MSDGLREEGKGGIGQAPHEKQLLLRVHLRSCLKCINIYINIYIYIDIYILRCQKPTNQHSELKEALKRLEFQGFCVFCLVLGLSFGFPFLLLGSGRGSLLRKVSRDLPAIREVIFAAHCRSPKHPQPQTSG